MIRTFYRFVSLCALALLVPLVMPQALGDPGRNIFPHLRGNNVHSADVNPQLIERMAAFGCNAMRVNLDMDEDATPVANDALGVYRKTLGRLEEVFPLCRKHGIQVILCVSGVPGRKLDVFWNQTSDGQNYRDGIVDIWRALAKRYQAEPALIGYDILNEPTYQAVDADLWWKQSLPKSIAAIRESDSSIWVVVEPGPWGLPSGFEKMPVINDARVIYSFHHYMPHAYTHQGVGHLGRSSKPDTRGLFRYPGDSPTFENEKDVKFWDTKRLEASMQPVIDFQKRNPGTRILVGEFGVIRWAEGSPQWLRDSIDIFEKHGWDWTFHSFGGWNGWDPTYAADAVMNGPKGGGTEETDRLIVLKEKWAANAKAPSKLANQSKP